MPSLQGLLPNGRLQDLARLVRIATGSRTALVASQDGEGHRILGFSGTVPKWAEQEIIANEITLCQQVMDRGAPLVIRDAYHDARFNRHPAVALHGIGAYIGFPIRSVDDECFGVVSAHDVNPRDWTEDDMKTLAFVVETIASEMRHRQLFEAYPAPLWIFDRASLRFLLVNDAAIAKYGYSRDEFLDMTLRDIRPAADAAAVEDRVREAAGFEVEQKLWRHRTKSGREILAECSSNDISFDGLAARLVVANDVTERVRAQQEMARAKQRYEAAIDASQACFSEYDLASRTFVFDRGAKEMFGFALTGLDDERFLSRVHRDDVKMFRRSRLDMKRRPERQDFVFRFSNALDRQRWIRIVVSPIFDVAGRPARVYSGMTDVTELVEARNVAETALRQQTEFLASINHELRTPLNAILGMGQLLQMSERDPNRLSYLQMIEESGATLLTQIERLLELSQLTEGDPNFRFEHYDPVAVAGQAISTLRFAAMAKSLSLRLVADEGPRFAYGDPRRLRQILVILLENAVKFTDTGGVALEVLPASKLTLRFIVRDTGIGIPDSVRPLIFDAFTRGDGSIQRRHGGMGVGLALVRHIVDGLNGAIAVSSSDKGSTFTVQLPMVALHSAQMEPLRA